MKFLIIPEELFQSDLIYFLLTGLLVSLIVGAVLKRNETAVIYSAVIYCICEIVLHLGTGYFSEIILLFAGSAAIGFFTGNLIWLAVRAFRSADTTGVEL